MLFASARGVACFEEGARANNNANGRARTREDAAPRRLCAYALGAKTQTALREAGYDRIVRAPYPNLRQTLLWILAHDEMRRRVKRWDWVGMGWIHPNQ